MTTITREQLHERARRKVKELEFAITQSAFTSIRDGLNEELELARIALASLDAEPMFYVDVEAAKRVIKGHTRFATITTEPKKGASLPIYLYPPVPVVPEDISGIIERFRYQADHLSDWHHIDEHSCKVNRRDLMTALEFMDSCRAAMLQGKGE
ncbi:hypothetical protein ACFZZV_004343 [Salmonella enterica subsp. diarizonae serovar (6),14:z10:z]